VFDSLADLGISTSGDNNSLTLSDETALDDALANNLTSVSELFTNSTNGLAVQLGTFLENTVGDEGSLVEKQSTLTSQSGAIDVDIENLERVVQQNRQRMIDSFIAMETIQQRANQQLQFLQKQLGSTSTK
jgi:flagellar capping protein FliD